MAVLKSLSQALCLMSMVLQRAIFIQTTLRLNLKSQPNQVLLKSGQLSNENLKKEAKKVEDQNYKKS